MVEQSQDGKIQFPSRDGIGKVTVNREDQPEAPSLDTSATPDESRTSLSDQVPTAVGKDGQLYVLIDRGDGFVFRVPIPHSGEENSAQE